MVPENRPGPQDPASRPSASGRARFLTLGMLAVAITVVAAVMWVASRPRGHLAGELDPSVNAADRTKEGIALAAIVDRDGHEERRAGNVAVYAGDRLRAEISLKEDREAIVGFVGENGVWTELLPKTRLPQGIHVCPEPLRFDNDPSSGFLVAGSPEAVEHARETDDFRGLTVLPVRLEEGDR